VKKIVIPGEEIKSRVREHTYEDKGKTYSAVYGVLIENEGKGKIVPLKGHYLPRKGDTIIGIVEDVKYGGCMVDINTAESAYLHTERPYKEADVLVAEVMDINELKEAKLSRDRKLPKGTLLEVDSVKVPRIIGKNNSMINMIQELTGSEVIVGRNGRIWIHGGDITKVMDAINTIIEKTHVSGLTEKIKKQLEGESE